MTPQILLFKGRGLISAMIRWQTRSQYSHAAILLPSGNEIIESWQGKGVRVKPISDWSNVDSFSVHGMSPFQWDEAIDFAMKQLGKPYDYRQVLRFITRRSGKDDQKWFCSELVFAACSFAGKPLLHRISSWAVSPALLSLSPYLFRNLPTRKVNDEPMLQTRDKLEC